MQATSECTSRISDSTPSCSGINIITQRSLRSCGPPSREPQDVRPEQRGVWWHHCLQIGSWLWNRLPAMMCVVQGGKMKYQKVLCELHDANLFKKTFSNFTPNKTFPILTRTPDSQGCVVTCQRDCCKPVLPGPFIRETWRRSLSNITFQAGLECPVSKQTSAGVFT